MDMESTLQDLGHTVWSAMTAAEADEMILRKQTIDLAVIDYHLRDGDSSALAERLAAAGIPFIVASGSTSIAELGAIFAASGFLPKPFTADRLEAAVDAAVETKVQL